MKRIENFRNHLIANATNNSGANLRANLVSNAKDDDDVVVVSALRTPIGKAKRGIFKDTTPDVLLAEVLRGLIKESGIDPAAVGDIVVGNVLQPGAAAVVARMGQLQAGFPYTVPLSTTNRQCSSGLQAFANVVAAIKAGYYEIGIAAGVESMTLGQMGTAPDVCWESVAESEAARDCTTPMGITSENVAEKFGITRLQQDELAADSHKKASYAQENGFFDAEIVPVKVVIKGEDGTEREAVVRKDEGVRPGTTAEKLGKLRAAFKDGGSTTAGNSSQVSDGAAAVLVMKRGTAKRLGMNILGVFRSFAAVGVPPAIMGIGPAVAIPEALHKANLTISQIDIFEINEAFASQAVYCIDTLKIPREKVNPKGGAIALGHPLGCTGSRQIATLLHELKRRKQRYGVVSMCIGTGMGAAAVFESE